MTLPGFNNPLACFQGEPPMNNPDYCLSYKNSLNRTGGTVRYVTSGNRDFPLARVRGLMKVQIGRSCE